MNILEKFKCTMKGAKRNILNVEWHGWDETYTRWITEGLEYIDLPFDYYGKELPKLLKRFDLDMFHYGRLLNEYGDKGVIINQPFPEYEKKVLEDLGSKQLVQDTRGQLYYETKSNKSIPHYIKFAIETPQDFADCKWRWQADEPLRFSPDWPIRVQEYQQRTFPLGVMLFGFFGQMREWMGFEKLLISFHLEPKMIHEMCDFWADYLIEIMSRILRDIKPDFVQFWEDMAMKGGPMISPKMFDEFITPRYKRVIGHLRSHGIDTIIVDSDGDINQLTRKFVEVGMNGIYPLEIAAGTDPLWIRKEYGNELILLGGVDKLEIAKGPAAIDMELERHVAPLLEQGRFVPHLDHAIPPTISLHDFEYYLKRKQHFLA